MPPIPMPLRQGDPRLSALLPRQCAAAARRAVRVALLRGGQGWVSVAQLPPGTIWL